MKRVVVHVERLVLDGLRSEDRHAITLGVRRRLEQVFGDPQVLQQLGEVRHTSRLLWSALSVPQDADKEIEK